MKKYEAPAINSKEIWVVLFCESGESADGQPQLFAICKSKADTVKTIQKAIETAKRSWGDELIYEDFEMHTEDFNYVCSYNYEKIDCSNLINYHLNKNSKKLLDKII